MKTISENIQSPPEQPVFHKVAENLYRLESTDGYYALLKRGGKQFRRSLKTKDRKLAERRLNDLRAKIGCLKISPEAKLNFGQAANLWLENIASSFLSSWSNRDSSSEEECKTSVTSSPSAWVMAMRNARPLFLPVKLPR